jgi:hypothetical protein
MVSEAARAMGNLTQVGAVQEFLLANNGLFFPFFPHLAPSFLFSLLPLFTPPLFFLLFSMTGYELFFHLLLHDDPNVVASIVGALMNLFQLPALADRAMNWQRPAAPAATPAAAAKSHAGQPKSRASAPSVPAPAVESVAEEEAHDGDGLIDRLLQITADFELTDVTLVTLVCQCLVNLLKMSKTPPLPRERDHALRQLSKLLTVSAQFESDPPSLMEELRKAAATAKACFSQEDGGDYVAF